MVDIRYQFILKYKDHKESTPWKTTWLYFFQNNKIKQHIALIFFSLKIRWQNQTNFVGKISHQFLLWDLQSLQFQQHGLNKWICLLFAFKSLHYFQCKFKSCPRPSTGDQLAVSHYTVLTVFVAPCNRMYRSVLHFRNYFLQTCIFYTANYRVFNRLFNRVFNLVSKVSH